MALRLCYLEWKTPLHFPRHISERGLAKCKSEEQDKFTPTRQLGISQKVAVRTIFVLLGQELKGLLDTFCVSLAQLLLILNSLGPLETLAHRALEIQLCVPGLLSRRSSVLALRL